MTPRSPEAARRYAKRRNLLKACGRWHPQAFIDAGRARTHIRDLHQAGVSTQCVADLTGVSRTTLDRILYKDAYTLRPEIERRVLAVAATPANRTPGRPVDSTGTRRRLQALVAVGWSLRKLAGHVGLTHPNLAKIASGGRSDVLPATEDAVRATYDELWDQHPPQVTRADRISVAKALALASRRGWVVPMAWDDDLIDDPAARPDLGAKPKQRRALAENRDELLAQGLSVEHVAVRLGVKPGSLQRGLDRDAARGRASSTTNSTRTGTAA